MDDGSMDSDSMNGDSTDDDSTDDDSMDYDLMDDESMCQEAEERVWGDKSETAVDASISGRDAQGSGSVLRHFP